MAIGSLLSNRVCLFYHSFPGCEFLICAREYKRMGKCFPVLFLSNNLPEKKSYTSPCLCLSYIVKLVRFGN